MQDADYEIVNRIVVEDETEQGIGSAQKRVNALAEGTTSLGSALKETLQMGVLGFIGLGGTAGAAANQIVGLHEEVENAQRGLAGLISGITGMGLDQSIAIARTQLKGLREDAAAGVGELDNYTQGFQRILGAGMASGGTLDELRELNKQALTVGSLLRDQEGLRLAPMDVQQALTAGVSDRTTPIVMQALGAAGISQAAFNRMSGRERIDALLQGFAQFDDAVALAGQSFDAQMGTLRDRSKELLRIATQPLYDRMLSGLGRLNDLLEVHQDRLSAVAQTVGDKLAGAWDSAANSLGAYAALTAAAGAAQVAHKGGLTGLLRQMPDPKKVTFGLGKTGLESAGLLAGMGSLGATLSVVGGAAAAAAVGFLAVQGAIQEYPQLLGMLTTQATALGSSLGTLVEMVQGLNREGSLLNWVGAALIFQFTMLMQGLDAGVKVVSTLTAVLGTLFTLMRQGAEGLFYASRGQFKASRAAFSGMQGTLAQLGHDTKRIWGGPRETEHAKDNPFLKAQNEFLAEKAANGTASNDTHIHGDVKVEVKAETLEDPARVAMTFEKILEKAKRNPRSSKRSPLGALNT